jgi:hypothetical protein
MPAISNAPGENLPEAEQLHIASDPRFRNAGRDVLAEALASPVQAQNMNASRLEINRAGYKPPQPWHDYSELPAIRGHKY